jgi:hypothetical protein
MESLWILRGGKSYIKIIFYIIKNMIELRGVDYMSFEVYEEHFKIKCKYDIKGDYESFRSFILAQNGFEDFEIENKTDSIYDQIIVKPKNNPKFLIVLDENSIGFHHQAKVDTQFKYIDIHTKTFIKQIKKIFSYEDFSIHGISRIGYALVSINFFSKFLDEKWSEVIKKFKTYYKLPQIEDETNKSIQMRTNSQLDEDFFSSSQIKVVRYQKEDADLDKIGMYILNDTYKKIDKYLFLSKEEILENFNNLKTKCVSTNEVYAENLNEFIQKGTK